ncbi:unnamed protein product [Ixodes pacificus]
MCSLTVHPKSRSRAGSLSQCPRRLCTTRRGLGRAAYKMSFWQQREGPAPKCAFRRVGNKCAGRSRPPALALRTRQASTAPSKGVASGGQNIRFRWQQHAGFRLGSVQRAVEKIG